MLLNGTAWAQCTTGMVNAPGCPPPDHPAIAGSGSAQPPAPPVRWADRWGAIAVDKTNPIVGAVQDMRSKQEAQQAAISECKRRGGGVCEVKISYSNQCAAMVSGNSGTEYVRAETIEQAVQIGMQGCAKSGDTGCHEYYSGCSLPQRIQ